MTLRLSTATLLLAVTAIAGLAIAVREHLRPELVETGRPLDLVVVGQGRFYLESMDTEGDHIAVRSVQLRLNSCNRLVTTIDGREYGIEPPITVPHDSQTVHVAPTGEVTTLQQNVAWNVGQLIVARFTSDNDGEGQLDEKRSNDEPPVLDVFGARGNGFVQAGWVLRQKSLYDSARVIVFELCAVGCALAAVASWLRPRTSASETITVPA